MACIASNSMERKVGSEWESGNNESPLHHNKTLLTLQFQWGKNFKVKRKVRTIAIRDLLLSLTGLSMLSDPFLRSG